ncbi:MAG: response regulator [Cyanobacteria bacterium]|nr:response regulator [Cyanobacteriota bacterium]
MKILLVEDEPLWQQGVKLLLKSQSDLGFELVGIVDNYDDALSSFDAEKPDVVLLDWKLRGSRDGLEIAAALVEQGVSPGRLVLVSGSEKSMIPPNPYHYVPKASIAESLVPTLKEIAAQLSS